MTETQRPLGDATPAERELWEKAERRRHQNAKPLIVKESSVKPVVTVEVFPNPIMSMKSNFKNR